jgi:hypothetical protein
MRRFLIGCSLGYVVFQMFLLMALMECSAIYGDLVYLTPVVGLKMVSVMSGMAGAVVGVFWWCVGGFYD